MCLAIAVAWSDIPTELIGRHELTRHVYERGGEREIQFHYRHAGACLPVWRDGELEIVPWGNFRKKSRYLPRGGWTWQKDIDDGHWQNVEGAFVDIPAAFGFENGRWYSITQGIRGLLVMDEQGEPVIYMICEPASHYYKNMCHSDRMPVFIRQRI